MDTTAKQMQMAFMFEEGGIADDGMNVDPVSGNEIPPGSLAKEVRDDVPAQLSEGEYVVPADVVRFYGVKFFEELRTEAKRGLMDMEANGRIGGEPVSQTIANRTDGDLTPQELAAIEAATGMALGGVVRAAGGKDVSQNPAMQPQFTQQQGISAWAPGYLSQGIINQAQGTEQRTVFLYPPDGGAPVQITLPIEQAKYDDLKAQGYTETPVEVKTEAQTSRDDNEPPTTTIQQPEAEIDLKGATSEDLTKTAKSLSIIGNVATGIAAMTGTPISAIINTGMVAKYNDIVEELNNRGENTGNLERKGSIFGGEAGLYDNLIDRSGTQGFEGNKKGADFGDTWLGDLLGFDGKAGVDGPGLKESFGGARRTSGTTTTTTGTPKKSSGNVGDDKPSSSAPTSSPRPVSRPASVGSTVDTTDDARASRGTGSMSSGERASQSYQKQEDADYGIMNKGGMVKRRNTKKKK